MTLSLTERADGVSLVFISSPLFLSGRAFADAVRVEQHGEFFG